MNQENLRKIINKKGISLGDAVPAIMIIATLFIVLIIVIYILASMQTSVNITTAVSTQNETLTAVGTGGLPSYVSHVTDCNFGSFAVVLAMNATSGATIPTTNYTVNTDGSITNLGTAFNRSNWNVTYTNTNGGTPCTAARSLTTQVANSIPIAGLVLIIVLIAIVVTVLLSSMIMRRKGEGI
jgi:hypothetical protein